jgi:hypothetical protein
MSYIRQSGSSLLKFEEYSAVLWNVASSSERIFASVNNLQ